MNIRENLLGLILERSGALKKEQVQAVLHEQQRLKEGGKAIAFGQIALAMKFVTEAQLRDALTLQKRIAWTPDQAVPLGAQLLAAGLIRPQQLAEALEEQQTTQGLIGQILIRRGAIKPEALAHFLEVRMTAPARRP